MNTAHHRDQGHVFFVLAEKPVIKDVLALVFLGLEDNGPLLDVSLLRVDEELDIH